MKKTPHLLTFSALLSLIALGFVTIPATADAQQVASDALPNTLPDSPGTIATAPEQGTSSSQQTTPPPHVGKKNADGTLDVAPPKRLFGLVPNFRSVSTQIKLPPQTIKEKLIDTSEDSFDYSALVLATAVALEGFAANSTPEFGRDGVAFGRYLWHSALDQTIENYLVEFIIPVIAHEDTRFYTLTRGTFAKRAGYSLGRVFITRSDSGKNTFNSGEILGAAASSGISNFYYPRPERTFGNFGKKYATNIGIDALSYLVKEFYPEISHVFSRSKQQTSAP